MNFHSWVNLKIILCKTATRRYWDWYHDDTIDARRADLVISRNAFVLLGKLEFGLYSEYFFDTSMEEAAWWVSFTQNVNLALDNFKLTGYTMSHGTCGSAFMI